MIGLYGFCSLSIDDRKSIATFALKITQCIEPMGVNDNMHDL